ncbi:MAG: hypothetical protein SWZ49_30985, partial [Cyanobacteriota bacterium]|nr:hypothetical protein [Cyanobacteriota bacterium]
GLLSPSGRRFANAVARNDTINFAYPLNCVITSDEPHAPRESDVFSEAVDIAKTMGLLPYTAFRSQ